MTLGFLVRIISIFLGQVEVVSFSFVVLYWLYGVCMLWIVSPHEKTALVHFLVGFMYMGANLGRFVDHPGFARTARVLTWRMHVLRATMLVGLLLGGLIPGARDYSAPEAPKKAFFVMMWERNPLLLVMFAGASLLHYIYQPLLSKYIVRMDDRDIFLLAAEGDGEKLKKVCFHGYPRSSAELYVSSCLLCHPHAHRLKFE